MCKLWILDSTHGELLALIAFFVVLLYRAGAVIASKSKSSKTVIFHGIRSWHRLRSAFRRWFASIFLHLSKHKATMCVCCPRFHFHSHFHIEYTRVQSEITSIQLRRLRCHSIFSTIFAHGACAAEICILAEQIEKHTHTSCIPDTVSLFQSTLIDRAWGGTSGPRHLCESIFVCVEHRRIDSRHPHNWILIIFSLALFILCVPRRRFAIQMHDSIGMFRFPRPERSRITITYVQFAKRLTEWTRRDHRRQRQQWLSLSIRMGIIRRQLNLLEWNSPEPESRPNAIASCTNRIFSTRYLLAVRSICCTVDSPALVVALVSATPDFPVVVEIRIKNEFDTAKPIRLADVSHSVHIEIYLQLFNLRFDFDSFTFQCVDGWTDLKCCTPFNNKLISKWYGWLVLCDAQNKRKFNKLCESGAEARIIRDEEFELDFSFSVCRHRLTLTSSMSPAGGA